MKSCSTCEHRRGSGEYAKCDLSGVYATTERHYPSQCGKDFHGWLPRLGFKQRLIIWWKGVAA